jgi:3D (Asp-Asp-Asp) domain-containing protein
MGMALYSGVVFSAFLAHGIHSDAMELPAPEPPQVTAQMKEVIQAEPLVYVTPTEVEPLTLQDEVMEPPVVHMIEDCTVTYYCCEKRAHICGTGDGITATGAAATPGVTCAVDPEVIPYGSIVMVDYGDGVLHEYIAQDTGISGAHVDLCVETHSQALALGVETATVYWSEPEGSV